jgi:hypothetical protein
MSTKIVSADGRSLPERSSRSDRSTLGAAAVLTPRAAFAVVALSSLSLWAAIWLAATYIASARLW